MSFPYGLHTTTAQKGEFCNLIDIIDQVTGQVKKINLGEHRSDPLDVTDDTKDFFVLGFEIDGSDER